MRRATKFWTILGGIALLVATAPVPAQTPAGLPALKFGVESAQNSGDVSVTLQMLALLTVLSIAPAILMMMSSFTRIVIVLSFARSAMGTQQVPPNSVLMGLALFLTFFTMQPTLNRVNQDAIQPYSRHEIDFRQALKRGEKPVRAFMLRQTRSNDLALFLELAHKPRPANRDEVDTYVLIPAFIISELKTAFIMGFLIFLPFLIIDLVVSMLLMSMGMMMLPPIVISLPFKLLLFIMVDGWHLLARSLALSFQ